MAEFMGSYGIWIILGLMLLFMWRGRGRGHGMGCGMGGHQHDHDEGAAAAEEVGEKGSPESGRHRGSGCH